VRSVCGSKMAKRKLARFAELTTFPHVHQHPQVGKEVEDYPLKGNWGKTQFGNPNPIVLELGCGKGEYTVGMAKQLPHQNFVGCDLKGNRIWKGAAETLSEGLQNVAFYRGRIENICQAFGSQEVSEIWITFPDPQPGERREKKRLTGPAYLKRYQQVLKPNGLIHLKTDHHGLYLYTLEVLKEMGAEIEVQTDNLYAQASALSMQLPPWLTEIKTHYEALFSAKGHAICYVRFRLAEEKNL